MARMTFVILQLVHMIFVNFAIPQLARMTFVILQLVRLNFVVLVLHHSLDCTLDFTDDLRLDEVHTTFLDQ